LQNQSPESEIILHNYPQSPVAEKVRVAFGIKGLAWRNVEIPRLPPKPMLTALTGGYRRTPVMQIGADIYCDSQCILRELERRHPTPTFQPVDAGLMWCLSRWTDGALFDLGVKLVLGAAGDDLPADFAEDRGRLYLGGDNWAKNLKAANETLPHQVAQMRTALFWLDGQLTDSRAFLTGEQPAAIDAQVYHVVWFLRGRWTDGPAFLSEFAALERWEQNVLKLGHGQASDMTGEDAIARAGQCQPSHPQGVAEFEPQGLKVGTPVAVGPDVESGEQFVEGKVLAADAETISIVRETEDIDGQIAVHFPRSGYRVEHL